jgi:rubrerythrin
MDIIEFAIKMEMDGMAFYKKHADETSDSLLKQIFLNLVEEEARHVQIFRKLKDNPAEFSLDEISVSGNVDEVKNIFQEMSQDTGRGNFGDDIVSVWTEALRIEEKAVTFYTEHAERETDPSTKKLMMAIADEETRHIHMIDTVLMYLRHPETFAQSAQFKNFQSLEGR